ncbi:MAG TPA: polyamine aminopropyltransferase [Chlamydiales bacterium]|jgi:spermidine synthase|nr:polyamine aminopropyltransferase [Chlamydiales bacterium]
MLRIIASLSLIATSLTAEQPRFLETLYDSWGQSLAISEEIVRHKSDEQNLVLFHNPMFGRVLALDGVIQLTEADEAIYHEMMVHVPLLSHDNPKSVLVIGGGDGGSLREVVKHSQLERIVLVDIDQAVITFSKEYLPKLSNQAFEDPRITIVIADGAKFVADCKDTFDVIICDSTDPIGPGEVLFTSEFYGNCKKLLTKNGIFVNQNGVPFLQQDELTKTLNNRKPYFKNVGFYTATVPTYVGGPMAFGWASDKKYRVTEAVLQQRMEKLKTKDFFYYTPAIHKAAFVLPNYMLKVIEEK